MFVRFRLSDRRLKVYITQSVRCDGSVKQTIVAYLGSVPADPPASAAARAIFWETAAPKLRRLGQHQQRLRAAIGARVPAPTPRRLAPGANSPAHDLVHTPLELARAVVDAFAPSGRLLDPCRGEGAFYEALRRHSADVGWCELAEGRDFLRYDRRVDWIITNPPWSKFRAFLKHAMTLANDIVFLVTVPHLTRARLRDIHEAGFGVVRMLPFENPPPPWPGGGFQLAAVHVRRGAVSLFA